LENKPKIEGYMSKNKKEKQKYPSGMYWSAAFAAAAMSVAGVILADQHFKKNPEIPTKVVEVLNDLSGCIQERYGVVHPSLKSANGDMQFKPDTQKTR
jgi:cytochrome b subunit of formate dehydrogenase